LGKIKHEFVWFYFITEEKEEARSYPQSIEKNCASTCLIIISPHPPELFSRINSMNTLHALFKKISEIEPSEGLEKRILRKIALNHKKQISRDMLFYRVWSFGSSALAIYAIFAFGNSIIKSEFWSMTSLLFSDIKIVAANWSDYAFSILETLPVISLIFILIPIFALVLSVDFRRNLKNRIKSGHYKFA
jgi:hypothetical protein